MADDYVGQNRSGEPGVPAGALCKLATDAFGQLILSPSSFAVTGVFLRLADAEAAPGPALLTASSIVETGSVYVFFPGSVLPIDHVVVLGHTGGVAGRWVHQGDALTLAPEPTPTDDAAHVQTILTGNAGQRRVHLGPGSGPTSTGVYHWAIPVDVPNDTTITSEALVTINSTIAPGLFSQAAFRALGGALVAGPTTLTAAAARGATQITVAAIAGFAIGMWIYVSNANGGNSPGLRVSTAKIINIAGNVITMSRPLERGFAINDDVQGRASVPENITLDGGGATMTGTGTRFIEIAFGQHCFGRNWIMSGAVGSFPTDYVVSFDTGGFDCHWTDIVMQGSGAMLGCIALESCDHSTVERVSLNANGGGYCISLFDCSDCGIDKAFATGATAAGITLTSDTSITNATTQGCIACWVSNSTSIGNLPGAGLAINNGSIGTQLSNLTLDNNAVGLQIGDSVTHCEHTQGVNVRTRKNTTYGIAIGTLAGGWDLQNLDVTGNGTNAATGTGMLIASSGNLDGLASDGGNGLNLILANADNVELAHLHATGDQAVFWVSLQGAGNRYTLRDSFITAGPNAGVITSAGVLSISGTRLAATLAGSIGVATTGGTVRIGRDNDWDATGFPTFVNGGGVFSQGAVHLNGVVAQAVAFADLLSTDQIHTELVTAAGVHPGHTPIIVQTVGVGFTAASTQAADTSTFDWAVES